jgi:hypothetical protein
MDDIKEMWQEYKWWVIGVPVALLAIYLSGGIYRVATGKSWTSHETSEQRASRLKDCAQVYDDNPTPVQQLDSTATGVCRGFTESEVRKAQGR